MGHKLPGLEIFFETCYVIASVLFVVGTILFWPGIEHKLEKYTGGRWLAEGDDCIAWGCKLFIIGSVVFAAISTYAGIACIRGRSERARTLLTKNKRLKFGLGRKTRLQVLSSVDNILEAFHEAGLNVNRGMAQKIKGQVAIVDKVYPDNPHVLRCNLPRAHNVGAQGFLLDLPTAALFDPSHEVKRRQVLEMILYVIGCDIFLLGTVIWDPKPWGFIAVGKKGSTFHQLGREEWLFLADALFMLGSFIFAMAAYINVTNIERIYNHRTGEASLKSLRGISTAISTCFALGGFSFIAGTLGFVPAYYMECHGSAKGLERIGCAWYLVGSFSYLFGSILSLRRVFVHHRLEVEHEEKVVKIQDQIRRFQEDRRQAFKEKLEAEVPSTVKNLLKRRVTELRRRRQEQEWAAEGARGEWDGLDDLFWCNEDQESADAIEELAEEDAGETLEPLFWSLMQDSDDEEDDASKTWLQSILAMRPGNKVGLRRREAVTMSFVRDRKPARPRSAKQEPLLTFH